MFTKKVNFFGLVILNQINLTMLVGNRESSLRAILTDLNAALLILIRFSQGCESLEQRRSSCRE
jgi:hypothetical protein